MSTRAVLARPRGGAPDAFEGVYLHNAGGPAEMGPVLWALMRDRYRFEPAGFWREMIDDNLEGWSSISDFDPKAWDGKTKLSVDDTDEREGPVSFKGDAERSMPNLKAPPINESSDNWGAIFVYVVAPEGLRILTDFEGNGYSTLARVPWGSSPDWAAIEAPLHDEKDDDDPEEAVLARATAMIENDDAVGAQAALFAYATELGHQTPELLAGILATMALGVETESADEVIAESLIGVHEDDTFLADNLLVNLGMVLSQRDRFDETIALYDMAIERDADLSSESFASYTYAAVVLKDRETMERVARHVEEALDVYPDLFDDNPLVFDNAASLAVALGDVDTAFTYLKRCKALAYEGFADMKASDALAPLRSDPRFKKLFG